MGQGLRGILVLTAALVLGSGCSSRPSATDIRQAHADYEEGMKKLAAQDFAGARELLVAAASGGGLQVDRHCEAKLQQAYCEGKLGNYAVAHAILDELAEGAPDLARVHAMRAFVFQTEGNAAQANQEMVKARQLDRNIKPFS